MGRIENTNFINSCKGVKLGVKFVFYTIYKITNLLNDKIYIGKHQTKDLNDGYMGSGKHLKRAISKHGIKNFKKEILFVFDNENEMNDKEAEIVDEDFVLREDVYNICVGGQGGFSYINNNKMNNSNKDKSAIYIKLSEKLKGIPNSSASGRLKERHRLGLIRYDTFSGRNHSEETKRKIGIASSKHQQGELNSQYGSFWITDGKQNMRCYDNKIPKGWYKGRTFIPILNEISKCNKCVIKEEDIYWWDTFEKSDMTVSDFVEKIYPKNRASFYNMKNRIMRD